MKEWESPINMIVKKVTEEFDKQIGNEVVAQLKCKYGIDVDTDRLLKIMQDARFEWNKGYHAGYNEGTKDAVKHGHWEYDETQICKRYICSECGEQTHTCLASKGCGSVPTNFCPNCGAKMDEVSE